MERDVNEQILFGVSVILFWGDLKQSSGWIRGITFEARRCTSLCC